VENRHLAFCRRCDLIIPQTCSLKTWGINSKSMNVTIREKHPSDFSGALNLLRDGRNVCRLGWNGKGQYLGLQVPDENSANTLPYIYIITVDGKRVPWLASQTDLLADDWQEVK
jgi:hypothetical protein